MNIKAVRNGLAVAARKIPDLRADPYMLGNVRPPSFIVGDSTIEYHQTFQRSALSKLTFNCWLLISKGAAEQSQEKLDGFLHDGTGGIAEVLERDQALGGAAQAVIVRSARNVETTVGSSTYFGAQLIVEVLA